MKITDKEFTNANQRAARALAKRQRALAVHYDEHLSCLIIELENGLGLLLRLANVQGLQDANQDDLDGAEISPSGLGIHFPKLDVDLYIPGLLAGNMGARRWMAENDQQTAARTAKTEPGAAD